MASGLPWSRPRYSSDFFNRATKVDGSLATTGILRPIMNARGRSANRQKVRAFRARIEPSINFMIREDRLLDLFDGFLNRLFNRPVLWRLDPI